jgi:Trk K+ transport system NAD-binding subunit
MVRTRPARWLIDRTVAQMVDRAGVVHPAEVELLLRVHHGYVVSEVAIERDHWLVGRTLRRSGLSDIGLLVLGITRHDATHVGTPGPETELRAGDVLTVYGRDADVEAFTARREAPRDIGP